VALERREEKAGRVTGGLTPDVWLTGNGRIDPSAVLGSLSPSAARALSDAADAVVARAMLDGWSNAPLPLLERRLRALLAQSMSAIHPDPARQITLLGDGTRVAMRRLLEMTRGNEALWAYAADDDPAMRAALDILAPSRLPAMAGDSLPADAPVTASAGDSASVERLVAWTSRRYRASLHDLDSAVLSASVRDAHVPRVDGRLRSGVPDTIVAVHFGAWPVQPAYAPGRSVRLADPSGVTTPLDANVVARVAFRSPRVALADSTRVSGWRYGWAYLVVLPDSTSKAHTSSFASWLVVPPPADTPVVEPSRRRSNAGRPVGRDSQP
jgi:hypothetical protein